MWNAHTDKVPAGKYIYIKKGVPRCRINKPNWLEGAEDQLTDLYSKGVRLCASKRVRQREGRGLRGGCKRMCPCCLSEPNNTFGGSVTECRTLPGSVYLAHQLEKREPCDKCFHFADSTGGFAFGPDFARAADFFLSFFLCSLFLFCIFVFSFFFIYFLFFFSSCGIDSPLSIFSPFFVSTGLLLRVE